MRFFGHADVIVVGDAVSPRALGVGLLQRALIQGGQVIREDQMVRGG
ncbi:MAG: hypothetical protein ACYDAB_06930 [bacterium]